MSKGKKAKKPKKVHGDKYGMSVDQARREQERLTGAVEGGTVVKQPRGIPSGQDHPSFFRARQNLGLESSAFDLERNRRTQQVLHGTLADQSPSQSNLRRNYDETNTEGEITHPSGYYHCGGLRFYDGDFAEEDILSAANQINGGELGDGFHDIFIGGSLKKIEIEKPYVEVIRDIEY